MSFRINQIGITHPGLWPNVWVGGWSGASSSFTAIVLGLLPIFFATFIIPALILLSPLNVLKA